MGTSTLTYDTGHLNLAGIERLVRQLADLHNQGKEIILVSSGAVGAGMGRMGLLKRPRNLPDKQALAALGQGILMQFYMKLFSEYGKTAAQVLLSRGDFDERNRYLNSRHALQAVLAYGMIPVINENDVVAVEQLRFGDNDTLSAMVASLVDADLLIILSDISGLYTADPRVDPSAALMTEVKEITPEIEELAGGAGSKNGTGGMITKIMAAKIAVNSGIGMIIADGSMEQVLNKVISGEEIGTYFLPKEYKLHSRERWLAFGQTRHGRLIIDSGAVKALLSRGTSLLPSGLIEVKGDFEAGDAVEIFDEGGKEIARGLVNYSCQELQKIKGCQCSEIFSVLGHKDYDEVIHRDNMVLLEEGKVNGK